MTTFTALQLADPSTDQATLAVIVSKQPELWTAVLAHPNCYSELAQYIREYLPTVGVAQIEPVSLPAPTVSAVPDVTVDWAPPTQPGSSSMEQMSAGMQQFTSGAKSFFSHTVAPTAKRAGASLQQAVNDRRDAAPGTNPLTTWAPIALPAVATVATLSLFLPIASIELFGYSQSANFFDEDAEGVGVMLLVFLLIAIIPAVLTLMLGKRWLRITAGVTGSVVGLFCVIGSFDMLNNIGDLSGATAGAGTILLAISSVAMSAAAIITLFAKKQ